MNYLTIHEGDKSKNMENKYCAFPKCGKELNHIEGRKKKKYCNQNCNTRHWQMLNPKYKPKSKRLALDDFDKLTELAKNTPLGKKIMEEISKKPLTFKVRDISPKGEVVREHEIQYSITDKKSFDGEKVDKITMDEVAQCENPNNTLITQYEEELKTLGSSPIANQRKKWLNKQIASINQCKK